MNNRKVRLAVIVVVWVVNLVKWWWRKGIVRDGELQRMKGERGLPCKL
ncbi:hypothetical protein Hanom_Chr17g01534851 [Helianthus anomalus]